MKLNENQIKKIDGALVKAGINYLDIRLELTDHIATALEQQEGNGSFEHRLKGYMLQNRKGLRKMNFTFMRIALVRTFKTFALNMFAPRLLLITAGLVTAAEIADLYLDNDTMVTWLFSLFGAALVLSCYRPVINIFCKRPDYSFTHGLGFIPVLLLYPSVFIMEWLDDRGNTNLSIAYFTFVIVISLNIFFTARKLFAKYKYQYHG